MALTKVQTIGIETGISLTGVTTVTTLNASTDTLSVGGTVNFGGNVSIAGTLTYEDVTNIDSVGIITARNGIKVNDLGVQVGTGATVDSAADNTLTFLTNGSERLRVTSDGSIGAGTDNPLTTFHIARGSDDNSILYITGADTSSEYVALGVGDNYGMLTAGGSGSTSTNLIIRTASSGTEAERVRIDSSGRLLINHTADTAPDSFDSKLQLCDTGDGGSSISIRRDDNTNASPVLLFTKSRSGSKGGNTVVNNNDIIGRLIFYGADGTDANTKCAQISAEIDGSPGSNDMPGRLVFSTTADGASSLTERMRIDSSGNLTLKTTSSAGKFIFQEGSSDAWSIDTNGANGYLRFYDEYNSSERMRIASNGDIGIGIAPAAQKLQVHESTASTESYVHITNAVSGGTSSDGMLLGMSTSAEGIVWNAENTSLLFATNNTEKMRIDNSGRMGIGAVPNDFDGNGDNLVISSSTHTGLTIDATSSTNSSIHFADGSTGNEAYRGYIVYSHSDDTMRIGTAADEQLRITHNSNGAIFLLDCTSTPSTSVNGSAILPNGTNGNYYLSMAGHNSAYSHAEFGNGNGVVGSIRTNGTATSYLTSSDYRLKENVVDLDGAITRVKQLAPKRFNFIADDTTVLDGFLAHEAQAVVPEAVTGSHNEVDDDNNPVYQAIDTSKLVPLLTAALQEAIAEIETLKTKVAALEG